MKRLSKAHVTKKEGIRPILKAQSGSQVKFNSVAVEKLGLKVGERVDVIEDKNIYYVGKIEDGLKLSDQFSFSSVPVSQYLKSLGKDFEITDETTTFEEVEGTWNKLVLVEEEKKETKTEEVNATEEVFPGSDNATTGM